MDEPIEVVAPWDGRRVPVTLLGGYLGSGKTTVINELLARTDRPIAVLVNDIGTVNIDAALIRRHDGDTIELTDGCVCCSLAGGLVAAFDSLRARPRPPDHVIVELSGVAEPARVTPWAGSDGFRLDGVVVLVDADQIRARLDDEAVAPAVRHQIASADLLVLTKLDLVDPRGVAAARALVRDIAPAAPLLDAADALATAALLDLATRRGGATGLPPPALFDPHEVATITVPDPIERHAFETLVQGLPDDVLRAKGIARTPDGARLLAQVVGRRRSVIDLPDAETQAPTDLMVVTARRPSKGV